MFVKILPWVVVIAILIQLVPYGHTHTNPPGTKQPDWSSPATLALFRRACFDCHSNETIWPWYSHVAPVSWLVEHDVDDGRDHLNFSEWNRPQRHAEHAAEEVKGGDMPPWYYLPMHPAARLTAAEKQALIESAEKSLGPQVAGDSH